MTYLVSDQSVKGGAPFFLYEFVTSTGTYRYTDAVEDIIWNSVTWEAFPIKHSEVKQTSEISKNTLTVKIPLTGDFSELFLGWSPDLSVSFALRRGHYGSAEVLVYWKGRISSHGLKEKVLELKCESVFTSLKRPGIRARYQSTCRHALYSDACGLNKADYATAGTISDTTGLVLTIPEASALADGWFTGGALALPDGSYRLIVSHVGDQITLVSKVRYLSTDSFAYSTGQTWSSYLASFSVILYPGCDRTLATCESKFSNNLNNGGFKWIPTINPLGGSSIV